MTNQTIRIHNIATDEIIDREMTDEEQAVYDATTKSMQDDLDASNAAKEAALVKLEALGLTVEDLKALGL